MRSGILAWSSEERAAVGVQVLDLLIDSSSWISRRIEQVEWEDDRTIWRTSTLDISFDQVSGSHYAPPLLRERALLPISANPRRSSRNLTVSSATGEPLPHLTRVEERALVAAGLTTWNQDVFGEEFDAIPLAVREASLLQQIETAIPLPGLGVPDGWRLINRNRREVERYLQTTKDNWIPFAEDRVVIAMPLASTLFKADAPEGGGRIRLIERHPEEFPREASPRKKIPLFLLRTAQFKEDVATRVLVTSAVQPAERFRAGDGGSGQPVWRREASIDDAPVTITTGGLGEAASYHLEVTCPAGLFIETAKLVVTREGRSGTETCEVAEDDPRWDTAHFYFPAASLMPGDNPDADTAEISETAAALILRPMYHGVLRAGINVSILTAVLLGVLTATLGWAAGDLPVVVRVPFVQRDTNSVVSLLLLVPTAALAALIRADEPLLTKWVLASYRLRLATIGLASFAVAVGFAIGLDGLWLTATTAAGTAVAAVYSLRNYQSGKVSRAREREWVESVTLGGDR